MATGTPTLAELSDTPKLKKSEMVAGRLRDYIIEHQLKPGDRLPTEDQLAELFAVSRVSVREATKALGFLGIIEAAPRRGLTVGQVSMDRVSKYLGFQIAVADLPFDELIATRIVIETGGLDHVAKRMVADPSVYAMLREQNDRLRAATRRDDWIENDVQFHCKLVAASGLQALTAFNDLLQVFFVRLREDFPRSAWLSGIESHQDIIDALRAGDIQMAGDLLRAHIESHRERLSLSRIRTG